MSSIAEPWIVGIVVVLAVCCAVLSIPDIGPALTGAAHFLGP